MKRANKKKHKLNKSDDTEEQPIKRRKRGDEQWKEEEKVTELELESRTAALWAHGLPFGHLCTGYLRRQFKEFDINISPNDISGILVKLLFVDWEWDYGYNQKNKSDKRVFAIDKERYQFVPHTFTSVKILETTSFYEIERDSNKKRKNISFDSNCHFGFGICNNVMAPKSKQLEVSGGYNSSVIGILGIKKKDFIKNLPHEYIINLLYTNSWFNVNVDFFGTKLFECDKKYENYGYGEFTYDPQYLASLGYKCPLWKNDQSVNIVTNDRCTNCNYVSHNKYYKGDLPAIKDNETMTMIYDSNKRKLTFRKQSQPHLNASICIFIG